MTELVEILDQLLQKSEEYQKGFRDGLQHSKGKMEEEKIDVERSEEKEQTGEHECNHCGQSFKQEHHKWPANHDCPEKYPDGYEPGKADTKKSEQKEANEVNIQERYPLERSTLNNWNDRRLEYELVILFNSKNNEGPMSTFEVMEAIWDWGNIDSQEYEYKRVQKTLENSKHFRSKNERPKKYFLKPNRDEMQLDEEVIQ